MKAEQVEDTAVVGNADDLTSTLLHSQQDLAAAENVPSPFLLEPRPDVIGPGPPSPMKLPPGPGTAASGPGAECGSSAPSSPACQQSSMGALAFGPRSSQGGCDPDELWRRAAPWRIAWACLSTLALAHGVALAAAASEDPFFIAYGGLLVLDGLAGAGFGAYSLVYRNCARAGVVSAVGMASAMTGTLAIIAVFTFAIAALVLVSLLHFGQPCRGVDTVYCTALLQWVIAGCAGTAAGYAVLAAASIGVAVHARGVWRCLARRDGFAKLACDDGFA